MNTTTMRIELTGRRFRVPTDAQRSIIRAAIARYRAECYADPDAPSADTLREERIRARFWKKVGEVER